MPPMTLELQTILCIRILHLQKAIFPYLELTGILNSTGEVTRSIMKMEHIISGQMTHHLGETQQDHHLGLKGNMSDEIIPLQEKDVSNFIQGNVYAKGTCLYFTSWCDHSCP